MPSKSKPRRSRSRAGLVLVVSLLGAVSLSACRGSDGVVSGCAFLSTGQTGKAAAVFAETLVVQPSCAEARVGWGITRLRLGETEAAREAFASALAADPTLTAARLGQAAALLRERRWAEAEAEYAALAELAGPVAVAATAGEAWVKCVRGDYAAAQALARSLPTSQYGLAAYVLAASTFARGEQPEGLAEGLPPLQPTSVGLGSCLTMEGAAWLQHPSVPVATMPAPGGAPAAPAARALTVLTPPAGATVRGQVRLLMRGPQDLTPAYVVVRVGSRFAAVGRSLSFPEGLSTAAWPAGVQPLQVEAFDAQGRILARGSSTLTVEAGDLTLAEPGPSPALGWVRRQLEQALTPEVLPGVWEQLRGEVAYRQGQLAQAQVDLTAAFGSDPRMPRAREELLAVSRDLGLPVLQPHPKLVEVPVAQPMVALTFDDGPHPKITPWVLEQLERAGAHATFFLVGKQVEMYPELVRQILARGHEVGSHGFSHTSLNKMTALDVERELTGSRAVTAQVTGQQIKLFRPPGGGYDDEVAQVAARWGFTPVFWTCNICDFYQNPKGHAVSGMLRKISSGGILLLHNGEDLTTEILPELLQRLKAEGYRLVSVSELLAARSKGES